MTLFLGLVQFALVLSFLVIIHELGHFLFAKLFKVHVEEFGLGYPPRARKLFSWKNTIFSLNWIPFGGFVKLEGEDGESVDAQKHPSKKNGTAFYEKSALSRLLIILAGAVVNFCFGMLAFSIYFSVKGIPIMLDNARVGYVSPGSPAATAHLPTQVDITGVEVNGQLQRVKTIDEVTTAIGAHVGQNITLVTTGTCDGAHCDQRPQHFLVYVRKKK